jgi:hypothetical protein
MGALSNSKMLNAANAMPSVKVPELFALARRMYTAKPHTGAKEVVAKSSTPLTPSFVPSLV